ncbi:MAG TPA: TetR/AcrR family transcriptional regulator, partial [Burkholderiaceae bacterium]|nr:TetR/AcrR family transcriptional regulator [Burkholderiaceae bacterium]
MNIVAPVSDHAKNNSGDFVANAGTSQRILDIAERLVQTRGFNGFSYADIASALSVTKASLHYHFPAKADLGQRLIERYERNFLAALETIDEESADAREKLRRYAAIYTGVLRNNRMCLCGMLAAEFATLPKSMREDMRHFFDANEHWLTAVLKEGKRERSLKVSGSATEVAQSLIGSLEGAMMIARSYGDTA